MGYLEDAFQLSCRGENLKRDESWGEEIWRWVMAYPLQEECYTVVSAFSPP